VKKITPHTWTIFFAVIALLALLTLAASLNTLHFRDGKPLQITRLIPQMTQGGGTSAVDGLIVFFRVVMILMWVLLPAYLILLIFSKEARKRLLRDILLLLPILLLLYIVSNNMNDKKPEKDATGIFGQNAAEQAQAAQELPKLPEFQPPPPWVTTVTSLVLAVVLVALVSTAVYLIWKRTRKKDDTPMQRIEMEARQAIQSIEAGGDLREVIQRCYMQMVVALRDYRMITRNQDMTPHEFEQALMRKGLPDDAVHKLTELFEQVRYGAYNPGHEEEHAAISSLTAIVNACQRMVTRGNT
jgi:hypothetical protein